MQRPNTVINYDVIVSHGPGCNDGATAAWAVWRTIPSQYRDALASQGGFYTKYEKEISPPQNNDPYIHPNSPEGAIKLQEKGHPIVFVFIQPGTALPEKLVANKRVLVLDLDMGDALAPLVQMAQYTFLVDHHDSTPKTINDHERFLLDDARHKFSMFVNISPQESGATLAWRLTHGDEIPPFVQIVRIGDTWQWEDYPALHARSVLKSLYMNRAFRTFPDIEATFQTWDTKFGGYVLSGQCVNDYEKSLVKQTAKQCDLGFIRTNDGTVYNIAYCQATVLHSEVGSSMRWYAESRFKVPIHFCATWRYASYKGIVSVSLRDQLPSLNLATIARNVMGTDGKGGGHVGAAAFSFYGLDKFHNFIMKSDPTILNTRATVQNTITTTPRSKFSEQILHQEPIKRSRIVVTTSSNKQVDNTLTTNDS